MKEGEVEIEVMIARWRGVATGSSQIASVVPMIDLLPFSTVARVQAWVSAVQLVSAFSTAFVVLTLGIGEVSGR